ncbi:MAG: hypothetical protein D6B28_08965 [Gammaproteobacteria bacterium]|nr:MAG: hypothetical protein D6B28_08965 [Gammaproteobacteria bacterium]
MFLSKNIRYKRAFMVLILLAGLLANIGITWAVGQTGPFEGQVKTTAQYDQAFGNIKLHGIVIGEDQKKAIIKIGDEPMKPFSIGQEIIVIEQKVHYKFSISRINKKQISMRAANSKIYKMVI